MRRTRERGVCEGCGRTLSLRTDGSGPVAHQCPHKKQCRGPAWAGSREGSCEACAKARDEKARKLAGSLTGSAAKWCAKCQEREAVAGGPGVPMCAECGRSFP